MAVKVRPAVLLIMFFNVVICDAVIYHLNESEYDRMPPLFELDTNYRSCLTQPGGVYCVAKFELHGEPHNELFRIIKEYSLHEMKHYNHNFIDRAVCVTKSCKRFVRDKTFNDLNLTLEGCINETIWTEYGLQATLAHVISCDKHGDQVPVDLGDWILFGTLCLLSVMNLIGSVYDVWYEKKYNKKIEITENPYLLSFSIFRNWKNLSNTMTDPKYERLRGIHGIKSITTFFVAASHIMWLVGIGYTDNPRDFEMSHDRLHYQIIFSGMAIVQIYFVISGCLLYFHLEAYSEAGAVTWRDIPNILLLRWIRLTPGNAIMVLFSASWLRHVGSGPLWKMFIASVATDCRTHWWKHLLYFNNYVTQDKYCSVQCWHVAAELQLFAVGLVVYVATASRRRYAALIALALVGMIAPATHVWLYDLDALVMHRPEFYRTFDGDFYRTVHVASHNNLSCHALGMAVGLISYYCVKNKIEYTGNKLMKLVTWCIPLGIIGLFLSGMLFYIDGYRPHVALRMVYAAVQRPAVGIMTAILIFNLVMKFENGIRAVLEWRGWMFSSRLCYSVYLLHVTLIQILLGARTQLGNVSFFLVIIYHFGVVTLSFAAAIPFYILLEVPLLTLTKVLMGQSLKQKKKLQ